MKNVSCAYCGSKSIHLTEVKVEPPRPSTLKEVKNGLVAEIKLEQDVPLMLVTVTCNSCGREDMPGCRADYFLWFLYVLLPRKLAA